jgi:uncharacterized lipoprotein NlpE involved in copper resistance
LTVLQFQTPIPTDRTVVAGHPTSFTVSLAGGATPFQYAWAKNGVAISGATNATYSIAKCGLADVLAFGTATPYTCTVTDNAGVSITTTPAANLTVTLTPLTITTQPTGANKYVGDSKTFTVVATGEPTLTYQWQKDGVNLADGPNGAGTVVAGSTTASLALTGLHLTDQASYQCIIGDLAHPPEAVVTTTPVALKVRSTLTVATNPITAHVAVNGTATFTIAGAG